MSSLPSLEVYQAAENARLEQVEALKDVDALLTMVIQPMASTTIQAGEVRGGTPLGLKAQNHQCTSLPAFIIFQVYFNTVNTQGSS